MKIIYDEQGFDLSDDGSQAEQIIDSVELQLAIKKLTSTDQEIIQMLIGGFTWREIEAELKVGSSTISGAKRALHDIIK